MKVKSVSAGVLSLLNAGDVAVEVWGVDDMDAIQRSYTAMAAVSSRLGTRDRVFAALRPWLRRGQEKIYPKALGRALAGELSMYADRMPLTERAKALKNAAAGLHLELKEFPALRRFLEISDIEKTYDAGLAQKQMAVFIQRLMERLHAWYKVVGPNQLSLDLQNASPIIDYWLETTGQSRAEFDQKINSGAVEPAFRALKEWIDAYLIEKAVQQSAGGPAAFHEEMMRLALRLRVPYFDLLDFRRSVAVQRDVGALKVTLADEISEASRWVASKMPSPEARTFWEAERGLDVMFRAMGLAVPPDEAESAVISPERFASLIKELAAMIGQPSPPAALGELDTLGPGLVGAGEFLRLSRGRSRHMVERTLELMRGANADRIALVVGGFHQRAIVRELEDHREVSWSVILPSIEVPKGSGAFGSFWTEQR
jgi:hypothetical protein